MYAPCTGSVRVGVSGVGCAARVPDVQVNSESVVSVSVVIPAFNRAATIEQAVASAREQTRAPREIIVVNDASSDETAEVARRAGARVVRLEKNQGCSSARNAGIRAAEGDAIAWLKLQ